MAMNVSFMNLITKTNSHLEIDCQKDWLRNTDPNLLVVILQQDETFTGDFANNNEDVGWRNHQNISMYSFAIWINVRTSSINADQCQSKYCYWSQFQLMMSIARTGPLHETSNLWRISNTCLGERHRHWLALGIDGRSPELYRPSLLHIKLTAKCTAV